MGGGSSTVKPTTVPERLAANSFNVDEEESHITVDQEVCRKTRTGPALISVCPAGVYSEQDGLILVDHAACLECGTCLAVAAPGSLTWHYPRGGFGVSFREG
jgi:ferredoxin like protein